VAEPGGGGRAALTWLGHATFKFRTPEARTLLVDPWTFGNPLCPEDAKDPGPLDLVLITQGHHDHLGDVLRIARAQAPTVVTIVELGKWLGARGVRNVKTMNVGGIIRESDVTITITPAAHSSSVDEEPARIPARAAGTSTASRSRRICRPACRCAGRAGARAARPGTPSPSTPSTPPPGRLSSTGTRP